jgi:hypothetical protein
MAILIDPPIWPAHGRLWSHLASDVSFEELHAFARAHGIPARAFEGDHYDVPQERYRSVLAAGARPVSGRELLHRLQSAGLRRPKRRGERVVASTVHPATGAWLDTLASSLPPLAPISSVLLLATGAGRVLVVPRGDGLDLPRAAVPAAGGWHRAGRRLVARLFDPDGTLAPDNTLAPDGTLAPDNTLAPDGTLAPVGYLRLVEPGRRATDPTGVRIDLIAHLAVGRREPDRRSGGRWVGSTGLARDRPALRPLIEQVIDRMAGSAD